MIERFINTRASRRPLCVAITVTAALLAMGQESKKSGSGKSPRTSASAKDKGKQRAGGGVSNNERLPSGLYPYRPRFAGLLQESPLTRNPAGGAGRRDVGGSRPVSPPRARSGSDPGPAPTQVQYSKLPNRANASFDPNSAIVGVRRASVSVSSSTTSAQAAKVSPTHITKFRQEELSKARTKIARLDPIVKEAKSRGFDRNRSLLDAQYLQRQAITKASQARQNKRSTRPGWNPFSRTFRAELARKRDFRRRQVAATAEADQHAGEIKRLNKEEAADRKQMKPIEAKLARNIARKEYFKTQLRERSGVENP